MDLPAGEGAGVSRQVGIPEMAVAHDHATVGALLPIRGLDRPPAVAAWRDSIDADVEAHSLACTSAFCEPLQVLEHLVAARIDRVMGRHRISRKTREIPRGDQVQ